MTHQLPSSPVATRARLAAALLLALTVACSDGVAGDAGSADAVAPDAIARADATINDRGTLDSGGNTDAEEARPDAVAFDAVEPDAAEPDALAPDATELDATEPDAAELDATEPDATPLDAGPAVCSTICQVTAPVESIPTRGLALWLRADRGANVGPNQEVCVWCDLSGHGHDLVAGGTPRLLPSAAGGRPAVQSGGGSNLGRGDLLSITATAGRTLISVFRMTNPGVRTQPIAQGRVGSAGTYLMIDANTFNTTGAFYGVYVTNNAYQSTTRTSTHAAAHVMRISSAQPGVTVLSQLAYFVNGAAQSITRTAGGLGNGTIESLASGNFTSVGNSASSHEVSEVLVYDRPITDPERAQVEAYLAARYGL